MTPEARRDYTNVRVPLNRRYGEHRVGDKRVVLCRDDESRNRDGIDYVTCAGPVVVVGAVSVPSVMSGVAIIEFADRRDPVQVRKIPFPW